jgi:predicted nucleotidyltransferase
MYHEVFIQKIVDKLKQVEGLQAIVLGGSWASGTQRQDSDIDLGLYYSESTPLDVDHIKKIAFALNDIANPVVTDLGGWGRWVNGGAWLTIQGQRVDFLYKNIDFISTIIDECNRGEMQWDYFQQPPYGFYSYIYCAETQMSKILYDPVGAIQKLQSKVTHYPQALKYKIINGFVWDAEFTLHVAKKSAKRDEVYFVAGCLTRIASNLVQVLYALNETYFISDKRLYKDVEQFGIKPQNFAERLDHILGDIGCDSKKLEETISLIAILLSEVIALYGDQYNPKYKLE